MGCILVHEVYPGSPAHSDGRIQAGDRILAVNGTDISGYSHNQASEVLSKTKGVVRLKIVRDDQQDGLEIIKVRLNKVKTSDYNLCNLWYNSYCMGHALKFRFESIFIQIPGQGLGLNIENSPNGVVIYGIVPNSEAAIDGTLQPGDLILSANGHDLKNATRDLVAQELRNSPSSVNLEVGRKRKTKGEVRRSNSNVSVSRMS